MKLRETLARGLYSVTRPAMLEYLEDLNRLQWLPEEEQLAMQHRQLYQLLEYANTYIPYYCDLFKSIGFHPRDFVTDPSCFHQLPLLSKDSIRQNFDRLITSEDTRRRTSTRGRTGGTTGEPLWYIQDQVHQDYITALGFQQMQWSGWQLGQPQGWLWGRIPGVYDSKTTSLTRFKDRLVGRFDSDAFIMTPESMDTFARQLTPHPEGVVWSYVSTMHRFAEFIQAEGRHLQLRAIFTAAEPLFGHQRQLIESVFDCPVFDSYSCREAGYFAGECEQHNGLHILTRSCYIEVLRDGKIVPDGEEGEFVVTNLTNWAMPLIRYKIEDWGRKSTQKCECGRGLPMLDVVEGRMIDLFKTRDGQVVYGAFAKDLVPTLGDVRQFQVIQKSLDLIVFRIVHHGSLDKNKLNQLIQVSKAALGEHVEVKFEFVDSLPATPSGKHRYLVSEVK